VVEGREFFIDSVRCGRVVKFSEWALRENLHFEGTPIPDRDVILMEQDFHCPVRKSVVMVTGCVYDAPLNMVRLQYPHNTDLKEFGASTVYLQHVVSQMTREEFKEWKCLEASYGKLLAAAEEKLFFEYRSESQSIFLNGKTLISGVPAKILRKILVAQGNGQASFDFRSFKYDPAIFPNPEDSGFETRWNRLQEKLHETTPYVRLEKSGKGEFIFKCDCPLAFQDLS
jgi:hypothetical protein